MATITGTSNADTLTGTSGADSIMGLGGDDHIFGGQGNDTIDAGDGSNYVYGEAGYNVASFASDSQGIYLSASGSLAYAWSVGPPSYDYSSMGAGSQSDTFYEIQGVIGSNYNDTIIGGLNAESLSGGAGADLLSGGGGSDTLTGGAGNDTFFINLAGQEIISDFTHGQDKIDVSVAGFSNFVDLKQFLTQSGTDTVLNVTINSNQLSIIFKNVSLATLSASDFVFAPPMNFTPTISIIGTDGNDSITGTAGSDSILGAGGDDTIDGGGGHNTIDGGSGYNFVSYANNPEGVYVGTTGTYVGGSLGGGGRSDRLFDIEGIVGSNYNDTIVGALNANVLSGGGGADRLDGAGGNDTLTGGAGNDIFVVHGGGQTVVTDFTHGQDRIDVSTAGIISFGDLKPFLSQSGADTVLSFTIDGQSAIYTFKSISLATLGASDFIFGSTAPTNLADAAIVNGFVDGSHNTASQALTGLADKGSTVTIYDDSIQIGTTTANASTGAWSFALGHLSDGRHSLTATAATAQGQPGPESSPLNFAVYSGQAIVGTENADTLSGTNGADFLIAFGGDDRIDTGAGNDTIYGGAGNDTIDAGSGTNYIDGGSGFNIVSYASAVAPVFAGVGFTYDSMDSGGRLDFISNVQGIIGGDYSDRIDGDLNYLNNNLLLGGAGDDTINGYGGDDTLGGGTGADLLTGGIGNDIFLVDGAGQKTITDFTHGQDKIDVSTAGIASFDSLKSHLTQVGADTVVSVTFGGQAAVFTLKNVSLATLTTTDFIYATPGAPTGLADSAIVGGYVNTAHDIAAQALTGTAEKGSTVTVYDGATKLGTAGANATTGVWSYTLGKLADGAHSLTATATNGTAQVGPASTALKFTVDTAAPLAPTGLADAAVSAGHVSAAANLATQALTGTAEKGAKVTVYDGAAKLGTVVANATTGAWSFTLGKLSAANHSLTATATDVAGNLGPASPALAIIVDAPALPTAPANLADAAVVGGYVNAAHDVVAQALTGTADKGATVTVYDGATKLGTVVANTTTGVWSYTLGKLADGAHSLTATATNATAQTGPASTALGFTVDTKPPVAPTTLVDAAVSAGHVSNAANLSTQSLTGTAEAGSSVTVYDGATKLGVVTASNAGGWTYTLGQLGVGAHSLTATAADAAGNVGPASAALAFTVDAPPVVPLAPSGLADAAIAGGYVNKAGDVAAQALTGTAAAGVTITVYDGATKLGTTTALGDGTWSYTLGHLADGAHSLTATATDAAAHVSAASAALSFKVDTLGPATPGSLADAGISQGLVNAAHNLASQTLTGKTDPWVTVAVYDGATLLGTVKAGATGAWSYVLGALSEGAHKLTAIAADAAGNPSLTSNLLSFSVDTHAPGAPASLADAAIVGGYVNASHDLATQALTGKAEAYAYVSVYDGAAKLGQVQVSGTGDWSYTLGKLADGAHSLSATTADKAGNIGPASGNLAFVVDTQAPGASVSKAVVGAVATTLTLSGVSEAGATLAVSEGATKLGSAVADSNGAWTLTLSGLTNTLHTLGVTATDLAGNKAAAGPLLYSPAVNTAIVGTAAADLLIGRPGDTLTGGAGSDLFVFGAKAGQETITDFTPASGATAGDLLQIDHTLATSFANLLTHATQVGANVSISFPTGEGLLLQNVQLSSLHAGDFLFV